MIPEFEEKSFEMAHSNELYGGLALPRDVEIFSMGQVVEGQLGFDLLARLPDVHPIFSLVPRPSWPEGIPRSDWAGPGLENRAPDIRANMFLQYKRSEYLQRSNAKYIRSGLFDGPYYRFRTYTINPSDRVGTGIPGWPGQHEALVNLEEESGDDAIVLYAAPRFHTWEQLLGLARSQVVIRHSEYVKPSAFGEHNTCVFDGRSVYFNPEPERAPRLSFSETLASVPGQGRDVMSVVRKALSDFRRSGLSDAPSFSRYDSISEFDPRGFVDRPLSEAEERLILEYVEVEFFALVNNVRWLAITSAR